MAFVSKAGLLVLSALGLSDARQFRGSSVEEAPQIWKGPTAAQITAHAEQLANLPGTVQEKPSLSVFVLTRVDGLERRAQIRDMWQTAADSKKMNVTYNFAVCAGPKGSQNEGGFGPTQSDNGVTLASANASLKAALQDEIDDYGDVIHMDCDEGYGEGALTKKTLASMKYFWQHHTNDYFMKIDDDSFLAWSKYEPHLLEVGHPYIYMGIEIGEGVPCRNKEFRWYEPYSTFSQSLFPKGMSGGSGYLIGRKLIDIVLNTGLGEANILYNEDRATGLWMYAIDQSGAHVDYQDIRGIDGFWAWNWAKPTEIWDTWGDYQNFVHHGLDGKTIQCLAEADQDQDPKAEIDDCFEFEEGKQYAPLTCASLNTAAQEEQKNARAGQ